MNEKRKRYYPSDRAKLYALRDRLEHEIADRQERLINVRRLIKQADALAIVNTAKTYNVTPEKFVQLLEYLQTNNPGSLIDPEESGTPGEAIGEIEKDHSFDLDLEETEHE